MKIWPLLLAFLPVFLTYSFSQTGSKYPELKVGDPAPDFSLPYATKDSVGAENVHLSSLIGTKAIILAFYPADWSGGCTREVCTLRDNFASLSQLDADVIGISGDYPYSHHEWAKFHNLPFLLASDHNHEVAALYHSYRAETGYNSRTVYVINKLGRIAYVDLAYTTKDLGSFNKLQDALRTIQ